MRTQPLLLGFFLVLLMPAGVFALAVPFVGSPFAHMTIPFFEPASYSSPSAQSAAASSVSSPPGKNDICYSVAIKEFNGNPIETYSQSPDDGCETLRKKYPSDKAACQSGGFRDVAGDYAYTDSLGKVYQGNRCDHLPGESSGGAPVAGLQGITPDMVSTIGDPTSAEGQAKMVDMYKSICVDGTCVPQDAAQTIVQSDPQKAFDLLSAMSTDDQTQAVQIAKDFNLDPNVVDSNMNQIEPTGDAPGNTTNENSSKAPFNQQSFNDQINSITASDCDPAKIDCSKFQQSMRATFGAECGNVPNCARDSTRDVFGSFQQTTDNYNRGIQAYADSCDQSTEACQSVTATCTNGAADRMTHICSTAAAVGIHAPVEATIQSSTSDPSREAAAHMLYQIAPGQWMAGQVNDLSYPLSDASRNALCNNKVCLSPGATGNDAVDGLLTRPNMQQGIYMASNGGTPGYVIASSNTGTMNSGGGAPTPLTPAVYTPNNGSPFVQTGATTNTSTYSSGNASSPFGSNSMQQMMQMMMMQNMMASMQQRQQALQQSAAQQQAQQMPPPTLSLNVQPLVVKRGTPVFVSWSASGASQSTPCTITYNNYLLGKGNTGSTTFNTSTSTPNSVVFNLACLGADNIQVAQQSATVVVQ